MVAYREALWVKHLWTLKFGWSILDDVDMTSLIKMPKLFVLVFVSEWNHVSICFFLIPISVPVLVSTISSCVHIIDCDLVCLRWLLWWLLKARWSHSIGFYFSTLHSFQQTIQLFCQLCWLLNIHGGLFCWSMCLTYVPTSTWLLMWCSTYCFLCFRYLL